MSMVGPLAGWICPSWCIVVATMAIAVGTSGSAADAPPATDYEKVIAGRAEKIVAALDSATDESRERARESLLHFFRATNAWHEAHGPRRKELKSAQEEVAKAELAALEGELATIRGAFLERLSGDLSPKQVEKVKDGLTYNVLHVTERAYHEMIETLTSEQKAKIHDWLVEARDLAISEGSSEAKHGVFGKYKGRINNYLSQQGYDLKQEERGWQARRKAAAAAATSTTTEAK